MKKSKQQMIEEFLATPIQIGETVIVKRTQTGSIHDRNEDVAVQISGRNDDGTYRATYNDELHYKPFWLNLDSIPEDNISRRTGGIGANPLKQYREGHYRTQVFKYDNDGILSMLNLSDRENALSEALGNEIPHCSFDPFVTLKDGRKYFYQRELVWTLEDKQELIESVYRGLDCGKVVIRERPWNLVEKYIKGGGDPQYMGLHDVVDGKQRIHALYEFVHDKFPDKHGNYWSDLSNIAQSMFRMSQNFATVMLREDATDLDTLRTFQNVNTRGVAYNVDNEKLNNIIENL